MRRLQSYFAFLCGITVLLRINTMLHTFSQQAYVRDEKYFVRFSIFKNFALCRRVIYVRKYCSVGYCCCHRTRRI